VKNTVYSATYKFLPLFFCLFLLSYTVKSQVLTKEDSLAANLLRSDRSTVISAYGEVGVTYDLRYKTGEASLTRNVLFLGHKFSDKVSLFSEMELENALVVGGSNKGEISMEQAFLKFNVNKHTYITAGLFIPRIGTINENHLPTTFNGFRRPMVETLIIPAVWRELGIGLWGTIDRIQGLNYSIAVMNGLNSANFGNSTGIASGRFEGSRATASNLAVNASLLYYFSHFRVQVSGYYGGSVGLNSRVADSLKLNSGAFGTPVALVEGNLHYDNKGFSFKALATMANITDAYAINRAYANNTPSKIYGAYAEIGYDIFKLIKVKEQAFKIFARYETLDMNAQIPENGITNGMIKQQYLIAGFTYIPTRGVCVKLDYTFKKTGEPNSVLYINPFPQALPYYTNQGFINLGIGYSF
jgi:hypothetical protein